MLMWISGKARETAETANTAKMKIVNRTVRRRMGCYQYLGINYRVHGLGILVRRHLLGGEDHFAAGIIVPVAHHQIHPFVQSLQHPPDFARLPGYVFTQ